jgi:hypothetical protein
MQSVKRGKNINSDQFYGEKYRFSDRTQLTACVRIQVLTAVIFFWNVKFTDVSEEHTAII